MSTFKTNICGFDLEVEYDYTPYDKGDYYTPPTEEWVEILDYRFLSETPDFENDVDRKWFEEKIEENIRARERSEMADRLYLRPYLLAKTRRKRDI